MSQKSSIFIQETRDRETWLPPLAQREGAGEQEVQQLLSAAALIRGAVEAIPIPSDAEERSRARAVEEMKDLLLHRGRSTQSRAPWYLRLGSLMRYVFTLGRRR